MAVNQTQHRHIDTNLQVTAALPAAGANVDSAAVDVRSGATDLAVAGADQKITYVGNAALERTEVAVVVGAGTALVYTKSATFTIKDCDTEGGSYVAIAGLGTQLVTGYTGNGNDETELRWKLPSHTRRYIKVNAAVAADAGTVTAQNYTLRLLT